jgi:hypothetical protein
MTTDWTLPTIIEQYSEPGSETADTAWNDINNFSGLTNLTGSVQTVGYLIHTARSPKLDIRNNTYYIRTTGFNFKNLPEYLSGIAVRLTARRYGRATDHTIQLCLNGQAIGKNRADLLIAPQKIYGGAGDLWETNLTLNDVKNNSFGFVVRFQAHKDWPHRSPALIDAVEIQIY